MKNSLTEIDGKFYQKCKVVMLPTEKKSSIFEWTGTTKKQLDLTHKTNTYFPKTNFKHLYFLLEEEIKIGDWYIVTLVNMENVYTTVVEQAKSFQDVWINNESVISTRHKDNCKKIIASTDESLDSGRIRLNQNSGQYELTSILPRPSNEFLQTYCKANGKIDEALVECTNHEEQTGEIGHCDAELEMYLKVAPDNTITIKPVKEKMYRREEVIKLLENYREFGGINPVLRHYFDRWISENL